MYSTPTPNTTQYTSTNSASEIATVEVSTGEVACAVRSTPCTSQGWRPISVTIQPVRMAMNPSDHV